MHIVQMVQCIVYNSNLSQKTTTTKIECDANKQAIWAYCYQLGNKYRNIQTHIDVKHIGKASLQVIVRTAV